MKKIILLLMLTILISSVSATTLVGLNSSKLLVKYNLSNNGFDMLGSSSGITYGSPVNKTYMTPKINGTRFFGLDTDMINITDTANYSITNNITITGWIYPGETGERQAIFCNYILTTNRQWCVEYYSDGGAKDGMISFAMSDGVGFNSTRSVNNAIPVNTTGFFAIKWDKTANNGMARIFINGTETPSYDIQEKLTGSLSDNTLSKTIGRHSVTAGRAFNGTIALLTMWNRSLSDSEIADLYLDDLAGVQIGETTGDSSTTSYYIDMDAPGTSTTCTVALPCKTLKNLTDWLSLDSLDIVYLDSCDVFRGTYSPKSTMTSNGTCSRQARVWGSFNESKTTDWTQVAGTDKWYSTINELPNTANLMYYDTNDYANGINDAILGIRETTCSNVNAEHEYCYNSSTDNVIVYSASGNPATLWNGVEITNYENPSSDSIFYIPSSVSNIEIKNISFAFANTKVFDALATARVNFTKNKVEYTWEKSVLYRASSEPTKINNYVTFNEFRNTGLKGASHNGMPGSQGEGVFGYYTNGFYVRNNTFYYNYGCVINTVVVDNFKIQGNYMNGSEYDGSLCAGIYPEGSSNGEVSYNYIDRRQMAGLYNGVEVLGRETNNVTFKYNIIISPINKIHSGVAGNEINNVTYDHNTFIALDCNTSVESRMMYEEDFNNLTFTNNIVYMNCSSAFTLLYYDAALSKISNYNNWFTTSGSPKWTKIGGSTYTTFATYQAGSGLDANSIYSDPIFVDKDNLDFRLSAGSSACTASSTGSYIGALACAANIPPTITSVLILNTTAYKNTNLKGQCNVVDLDGDVLAYSYNWYRNTTLLNLNSTILGIGNFSRNDWITFYCNVTDNTNPTISLNSSVVTILNSQPTKPTISVLGTTITYNSTDNDGDLITYYIYLNESLYTTLTATTYAFVLTDGSYNSTIESTDGIINSTMSDYVYFGVNGCGDGVINGDEECDLTNTNGITCNDFGFNRGTLSCSVLCRFDTSTCETVNVYVDSLYNTSSAGNSENIVGFIAETNNGVGQTFMSAFLLAFFFIFIMALKRFPLEDVFPAVSFVFFIISIFLRQAGLVTFYLVILFFFFLAGTVAFHFIKGEQ